MNKKVELAEIESLLDIRNLIKEENYNYFLYHKRLLYVEQNGGGYEILNDFDVEVVEYNGLYKYDLYKLLELYINNFTHDDSTLRVLTNDALIEYTLISECYLKIILIKKSHISMDKFKAKFLQTIIDEYEYDLTRKESDMLDEIEKELKEVIDE